MPWCSRAFSLQTALGLDRERILEPIKIIQIPSQEYDNDEMVARVLWISACSVVC
jgi:hypothetical protein